MILLFLVLIGILLISIGIWKRKVTYGKVLIGLGVLLIGIFFFGPFGIFYSCEGYSNYLRDELQKINKPCESSEDCELISYFPCKPYCINKEVDLSAFYSLQRKRPLFCPLYRCIAPEVKWRCICENNTCTIKEKELVEEKIEDETANWKTYRNEEYGYEIKYPKDWEYGTDKEQPNILWLGHPLSGKQTFSLIIIVYDNPDKLTSKQWVEKLLQENREKVEKKEAAPITYREEKEVTIAGLPAYELYGVFAYDQSEEQIYLAKENYVYRFSFPVAEENLNLSNPIENNRIIHQMLSTFKFLK